MKNKLVVLMLGIGAVGYSQTDTVRIVPKDTTSYSWYSKEKKSEIFDDLNAKTFSWENSDRGDDFTTKKERKSGKFKGHWAGIDFGINAYLNKNKGFNISGSDSYMSLNTSRSYNFNLNFFKLNYGLVGDRLGLVSGMGVEWYNYFFENNNSIMRDSLGVITAKTFSSDKSLTKSKLTAMYLSVPLLLELNFPGNSSRRFHTAVGVIGGLKVSSHTKVEYNKDGDSRKEKEWGSFNLNYLRYGLTTRVGYGNLMVYATYYPVPLFQKDKGPELYPINVGLSWTIF